MVTSLPDGQIGLDPALVVAPLRVDGLADRCVDLGDRDVVQYGEGVGPLDPGLGERRLVEQADGIPHALALPDHVLVPVLLAVGVDVLLRLTGVGEPVGSLPAGGLAEHGPGRLDSIVQRRRANASRRLVLPEWPVHGVEQAKAFGDAVAQVVLVGLERLSSTDVHRVQVHWRVLVGDPVGERPADTTGGLDADGVEAGGDVAAVDFGGLAHVVHAVGRERFRPVEEQLQADLAQCGYPMHGLLEDRADVLPIFGQRAEAEVPRDLVHAPDLAPRLEEAGHDLAGLLFEVRVVLGVAQRWRAELHPVELFGHDVEVLACLERHVDADLRGEVARPHTGGEHDHVCLDRSLLGHDAGDRAVLRRQVGDRHAFDDGGATGSRTLGQRNRGVHR